MKNFGIIFSNYDDLKKFYDKILDFCLPVFFRTHTQLFLKDIAEIGRVVISYEACTSANFRSPSRNSLAALMRHWVRYSIKVHPTSWEKRVLK